jgi:glutamyl-tRNA reductase
MRVGVIGINHKLANVQLRELLAKACQRQFTMNGSHHENHTFVLLSTCNRTEVYFFSDDLALTHTYLLNLLRKEVDDDFDQKVYSYFGQDCFFHLCRVTAGLDSAIIAETEIQGQVKAAYESAAQHVVLPGELHYLFQKSLNIGKRVRSELTMGRGMPDIEDAVYQAGESLLKNIPQPKILFVGASDINQKVLAFLKAKNCRSITLCNRSLERSRLIAENQNIAFIEWCRISEWIHYDWIIFGTKSPNYVITLSDLSSPFITQQKLIIDLCVPRNVDPQLGEIPSITLWNIDGLNHCLKVRQHQMASVITQAEQMVTHATFRHTSIYREKERTRRRLGIG